MNLPADDLRAAFERVIEISPFTKWMATTIGDIQPGRVVIRAALRPELRQHHGYAHGAVVGYMADTACSWAAASVSGDVVTSEYKINFLSGARGAALEAEATVIRAGKRQAVVRADVHTLADDGTRECVATCLATIAVLGPRPAG